MKNSSTKSNTAAAPGAPEKGTRIITDLTTGSVTKTLIRFALPLLLSGFLQMIYNMVDMIVVGRFVGTEGLSAVAIGGEVLQLVTFIAMGFSNAGQILLSRYVGEERHDRIGNMVGTLFTLLMGIAAVLTVLMLIGYQPILHWLNTPAEIYTYTQQYSLICVIGIVFIYGYNLVSAILRGMGDSRHPFIFIAIASVVNIVLDLLFVGPMHMGPAGAALATIIGQAASFIFAISLLYRNRAQIHFDFKPRSFRLHEAEIRPLLALGIPMVIQSAAVNFSMLFINSYINTYGTVAVAVTGVAKKLELMINVVAQAMSASSAAMISQALGAGKTKRVPKIMFTALWIVAIPTAVFALITALRPQWLFGLFSDDPAVMDMAITYIPVAMIQYLGCTTRPAGFGLINGSANPKMNLTVAIVDGIISRIGLGLLLGVVLEWGIRGFWYGNAISGLLPFVIGICYLLSGTWKKQVAKPDAE